MKHHLAENASHTRRAIVQGRTVRLFRLTQPSKHDKRAIEWMHFNYKSFTDACAAAVAYAERNRVMWPGDFA